MPDNDPETVAYIAAEQSRVAEMRRIVFAIKDALRKPQRVSQSSARLRLFAKRSLFDYADRLELDLWLMIKDIYPMEMAEQAYKLCLLGARNEDIARFFRINIKTAYRWTRTTRNLARPRSAAKKTPLALICVHV